MGDEMIAEKVDLILSTIGRRRAIGIVKTATGDLVVIKPKPWSPSPEELSKHCWHL